MHELDWYRKCRAFPFRLNTYEHCPSLKHKQIIRALFSITAISRVTLTLWFDVNTRRKQCRKTASTQRLSPDYLETT
jgi:hypothetical protein